MKLKGLNIAVVTLACLTVVALAGSSLGTLAWYAYSTRATASYSGTAVRKTEQLQIGLAWDMTKATEAQARAYATRYAGTEDPNAGYQVLDGKTYTFMPAGQGFSSTAINEYLKYFGHATNELPPVTSKSYTSGGTFNLYESPTFGYTNNNALAAGNRYVELPFAFRIWTTESGTDVCVKNQNIWLTDVSAAAEGTKDVKDALRLHVANTAGEDAAHQNYILNPSASLDGSTAVGGMLDLNGDGIYDYGDAKVDNITRHVEYLYGQVDSTGITPTAMTPGYQNINNVTGASADNLSTFVAAHGTDVYGYSSYTGMTVSTANYLSFGTVRPIETAGVFSGGYPIAKTSNTDAAVGETMITVWLEGWDHAIIDANIGAKFNLGLQFEINRV